MPSLGTGWRIKNDVVSAAPGPIQMTFESLMMGQHGLDPYGSEELGDFISHCMLECGSFVPECDPIDVWRDLGLLCTDPTQIN